MTSLINNIFQTAYIHHPLPHLQTVPQSLSQCTNQSCVKQKRQPDWELNPGPSRHIPDALTTGLSGLTRQVSITCWYALTTLSLTLSEACDQHTCVDAWQVPGHVTDYMIQHHGRVKDCNQLSPNHNSTSPTFQWQNNSESSQRFWKPLYKLLCQC